MKRRPTTFSFWLLALFFCAQLFSIEAVVASFDPAMLDLIDPEEVVTLEPFVRSNVKTMEVAPATARTAAPSAVVGLLAQLAFFWRSPQTEDALKYRQNIAAVPAQERLWLLNRRLLI
jgi:hypothetical protein